MSSPPPPPPPHGEAPKTTAGGGSGLPPGKYDVFIIPEHSAGSGFLYLPSLRTNTNSFIAGFASALIMVVLGQSMAPAFQAWWANFQGMGNAGMLLLVIAVGLGAWSLGRQQSTDGPGQGGGADGGFYSGGGSMPGGGGFSSAGSSPRSAHPGSTPNGGPPPSAHSQAPPGGSPPSANKANGSYQRPPPQTQARPQPEPEPESRPQPPPPPPPQPSAAKPQAETPKNAWEKAREEVRRNEEERKAKQADEKRRAEAATRLKELREKEAKERAAREAERARREAEAKEKTEKEAKEARAKELRERLVREREDRRKKLEEEKKRKEEEASESRKSSAYAYSGVGEKTNPWPAGKPPTASAQAGNPPSPTKKPPAPTARTFVGTEEETYSFRPYDQPKRPAAGRRMSHSDRSESSWAPSQSTARTTPPPSVRGPYSTKDPDKIVIKAVYCFMNQYAKTPASQLISGVGSVTDGLILRVTTEGLFIDDDVRGVAQREWDVKAWTLKNVEVWCPVHFLACAIAANSPPSPTGATPPASVKNLSTAFFAKTMGGSARLRAAERGAPKTLSGDDADTYLTKMLASCKDSCRLGDCASKFGGTNLDDASSVASGSTRTNSTVQTGDWKAKGLHLLRATIRDQDGKRYMFVIGEEEGWKVAVGLQRLRKGTQVRALGVAGLSGIDTKNTLEMLGWG